MIVSDFFEKVKSQCLECIKTLVFSKKKSKNFHLFWLIWKKSYWVERFYFFDFHENLQIFRACSRISGFWNSLLSGGFWAPPAKFFPYVRDPKSLNLKSVSIAGRGLLTSSTGNLWSAGTFESFRGTTFGGPKWSLLGTPEWSLLGVRK